MNSPIKSIEAKWTQVPHTSTPPSEMIPRVESPCGISAAAQTSTIVANWKWSESYAGFFTTIQRKSAHEEMIPIRFSISGRFPIIPEEIERTAGVAKMSVLLAGEITVEV